MDEEKGKVVRLGHGGRMSVNRKREDVLWRLVMSCLPRTCGPAAQTERYVQQV